MISHLNVMLESSSFMVKLKQAPTFGEYYEGQVWDVSQTWIMLFGSKRVNFEKL